MIRDADSKRQISSSVAVEQGQTVEGSFTVECETGYALSGAAVSDVTCEYKHSAAGSWTPSTTPISLTPWAGTTQTFNFRFTAPASATNYRRYLPLTVGKSTTSNDRTVTLDAGALTISGQNLTLTMRREVLTLGMLEITGQPVSFTYYQPNSTLPISAGPLSITGQAVEFPYGRVLGLTAGSLTITGQSVTLTYGSGYDSDAAAFFTAAGITDNTQKDAIDDLVVALKADGIWTKCIAIYPFVGGSSSAHAVNLKNPGTYDITWSGTVTHNSNGVTGNGTTGYGNTNITPSTHLSANNTHLSVYSRTDNTSEVEIGCWSSGAATDRFELRTKRPGPVAQLGMYVAPGSGGVSVSNSNGQGFYIGSRTASNSLTLYKNGSSIGTSASSAGSLPNVNIGVCAAIWASGNSYSTKNLAFASVGSGLTGTEAANFTTAVEAFQDALARGVA